MKIEDKNDLFIIAASDIHSFEVFINRKCDDGVLSLTRDELMGLRDVVDRALNTSAEELGDE